jgi:peptidoglycan/xylan/chitin deacetylase (PgdA/CDA1 family)
VGNEQLVWVNELNHALRTAPAESANIVARHFPEAASLPEANHVIDHCRVNFDPEKVDSLLADLRTAFGYSAKQQAADAKLYVNWDDVRAMQRSLIRFGNHTTTHPNLERLSEMQQLEEIEGAQKKLSAYIEVLPSLAYPFGHHTVMTAKIAADAGLSSVVEVGGYNHPLDPLAIGRVHLSGQSLAGLFTRMEVVEPIKGFIRDRLRKRRLATLPLSKPHKAIPL